MTDRVVFREYEKPADLDLAKCWKVEQLWDGYETDTLYTPHESDAGPLIGSMLLDQYSVRVTWPNGTVQTYAAEKETSPLTGGFV